MVLRSLRSATRRAPEFLMHAGRAESCITEIFGLIRLQLPGFPYNKSLTINASSNSLTRVAVFWLKRNSVTNHNAAPASQVEIADLNLSVYGPNGSLLAVSDLAEGNFEIVQFAPPSTGTYTITIGGSVGDKEHIGIAVW